MSTIPERIQLALDKRGLSWSKSATSIGLSAQAATKWKKGQIGKETLQDLAELLKVNYGWLATGQGEMTAKAKQQFDNATPTAVKKTAPLLNSVQAGSFTEIGDSHYDEYLPYFGDYGNDRVYWLQVTGDSMIPDFKEGEYVLINADRQARAGNYVAALEHDKNNATFKKYRPKGFDDNGVEYWHLVPSNDEYPIIDSRYQPFDVLGVAVERNQSLV